MIINICKKEKYLYLSLHRCVKMKRQRVRLAVSPLAVFYPSAGSRVTFLFDRTLACTKYEITALFLQDPLTEQHKAKVV